MLCWVRGSIKGDSWPTRSCSKLIFNSLWENPVMLTQFLCFWVLVRLVNVGKVESVSHTLLWEWAGILCVPEAKSCLKGSEATASYPYPAFEEFITRSKRLSLGIIPVPHCLVVFTEIGVKRKDHGPIDQSNCFWKVAYFLLGALLENAVCKGWIFSCTAWLTISWATSLVPPGW